MTVYLVDFENVKCDGLLGIDKLAKNDQVYIFYSINADRITFNLHNSINNSKADIKFYNIEVGVKNALDFQLVSYLGYLISKNINDNYVIVTKDTDFSVVQGFWKNLNAKVTIQKTLSNEVINEKLSSPMYSVEEENEIHPINSDKKDENKKQHVENKKQKKVKKQNTQNKRKTKAKNDETITSSVPSNNLVDDVKKLVDDEQQAIILANYIEKYKTKLGLNNAIVKDYGTTVGGQLYKKIKPLIADKKGN